MAVLVDEVPHLAFLRAIRHVRGQVCAVEQRLLRIIAAVIVVKVDDVAVGVCALVAQRMSVRVLLVGVSPCT